MEASLIRRVGGNQIVVRDQVSSSASKDRSQELFERGDWVEARFRARSKWLPGRVVRVNLADGTYDIR